MQNVDRSDDRPPNPVYLLSSLGGSETLRSYDDNRFVDRDLALATLEYRYPVWKALDAFLFIDEGRVFRELSKDFTLRDWHYSAGFGLRAWTSEAVILSAQIAMGKEGTRFIFFAGSDF
jgi:outer membrane protein assembly factor BamA